MTSRIVYHGSWKRLESFLEGGGRESVAGQMGDYGPGVYFTTSKADAETFGEVVGKYRVELRKPLVIAPGKPSAAEIARLQRGFRIDDETLEVELEAGNHPVAAMLELMKWVAPAASIRKFLKKLGYDGICVANSEVKKEHPEMRGDYWIVFDPANVQVINPRSDFAGPKKARKKTAKRKGPTALSLIGNCQRKWESYRVKPSKKRLQIVFDHLEKMKSSKSKNVKSERSRCLRAANLEAKRLKMK